MAYRFPLAAVLRVRVLAAEREELALGQIHAELAALRAALAQTEVELRETAAMRERAFAVAALPAMHLHGLYAVSAGLRERQYALAEQIAAAETRREDQVRRYGAAYRERETLVSLRAKGKAAFAQAEARREAKAADEAFLNKCLREARAEAAK